MLSLIGCAKKYGLRGFVILGREARISRAKFYIECGGSCTISTLPRR